MEWLSQEVNLPSPVSQEVLWWAVGLTIVIWFNCLIGPLSVMPSAPRAFALLGAEKFALWVPRWLAHFLAPDVSRVNMLGRSWRTLKKKFEISRRQHRHVNSAMFLPARVLAFALLIGGLAVCVMFFVLAIEWSSWAAASFTGALFFASWIPLVVTIAVTRYRWHRRVPFEIAWLQEASAVLSRHKKAAARFRLERAMILGDIADMEFTLLRRFRQSPSGSSRRVAHEAWIRQIDDLAVRSAEFERQLQPSSEDVWTWLKSHVEQSSRAVVGESTRRRKVSPLVDGKKRPTSHSGTRAAVVLVTMLIAIVALFLVFTFTVSGLITVDLGWDAISPWVTRATSLLALGPLFVFLSKGWRRWNRDE
ncbi:hypothetical protein ACPEEZ_15275 [Frigoribacterium sp. 2-23]|uniref:hypothetical protein n=1 Tax=Frigoribacterium sp. 2-23 TaxID=3415006 RepID=UPI003C6F6361